MPAPSSAPSPSCILDYRPVVQGIPCCSKTSRFQHTRTGGEHMMEICVKAPK